MTTNVSIKYDDDGQIRNRYIGKKSEAGWTLTSEDDWPEPDPETDEIPKYFYDSSSGEITIEYETIERTDDDPITE